MKKITKITLIITAVLLVTGFGFLIAGTVTAGGAEVLKTRLRSGELNFGNWHFEDGVYYKGNSGIEVTDFVENAMQLLPTGKDQTTEEFSAEIKCLEMETDLSNITILMSEGNQLKVSLKEGYSQYYATDVDDDTLTIRYDVKGRTFEQGPKIVVEVPKNQMFEHIYINTNLGEVNLLDLKQEIMDLEIHSDLGNIYIADCERIGSCITSAAMGNIVIEDSYFEFVDLSANMGNVEFSGQVEAEMTVQADLGNIEAELEGRQEQYNIQLSTDAGNVVFEGIKQGSFFEVYEEQTEAVITLNCDLGNVELSFE